MVCASRARRARQPALIAIPSLPARLLTAALAAGLCACSGGGGGATPVTAARITISMYPAQGEVETTGRSRTVALYLEHLLGIPVAVVVPATYRGVLDQLAGGQADAAFTDPLTYVYLKPRFPVELLSRAAGTQRGQILVASSSPITSVAGLRGRALAYGDALSASGNLFPRQLLAASGVNPDRDLRTAVTLKNQVAPVISLCNGAIDAAATLDDARALPAAAAACPDSGSRLRVLGTTPAFAGDPQLVRASLDPATRRRLQAALLTMGADAAMVGVLRDLYGYAGLQPATDADYSQVRGLAVAAQPGFLGSH